MKGLIASVLLACASAVCADYLPPSHYLYGEEGRILDWEPPANVKREPATTSLASASQCTNGPLTRSCWAPGYSVATDFDKKWPTTGHTRRVGTERTLLMILCVDDGDSTT